MFALRYEPGSCRVWTRSPRYSISAFVLNCRRIFDVHSTCVVLSVPFRFPVRRRQAFPIGNIPPSHILSGPPELPVSGLSTRSNRQMRAHISRVDYKKLTIKGVLLYETSVQWQKQSNALCPAIRQFLCLQVFTHPTSLVIRASIPPVRLIQPSVRWVPVMSSSWGIATGSWNWRLVLI